MASPRRWIDELSDEDLAFLRRFLLASGTLKQLAEDYGISYPTVRLRLDRLIAERGVRPTLLAPVWRVAATGFGSYGDAANMCRTVKHRGGDCLVVTAPKGLGGGGSTARR